MQEMISTKILPIVSNGMFHFITVQGFGLSATTSFTNIWESYYTTRSL